MSAINLQKKAFISLMQLISLKIPSIFVGVWHDQYGECSLSRHKYVTLPYSYHQSKYMYRGNIHRWSTNTSWAMFKTRFGSSKVVNFERQSVTIRESMT